MDRGEFHELVHKRIRIAKRLFPPSWKLAHPEGHTCSKQKILPLGVRNSRSAEWLLEHDLWERYQAGEVRKNIEYWLWSEVEGALRALGRLERNGGFTGRKDGRNRSPKSWDSANGWSGKTTEPGAPMHAGALNGGGRDDDVVPLQGRIQAEECRFIQLSTLFRNEGGRRFERFEVKERHRFGSDHVQHVPWSYKGAHPKLAAPVTDVREEDLTPQHTGKAVRHWRGVPPERPWEAQHPPSKPVVDWRKLPQRGLPGMFQVVRWDYGVPVQWRGMPVKWELTRQVGLWADSKSSRMVRWVRASVWRPRSSHPPLRRWTNGNLRKWRPGLWCWQWATPRMPRLIVHERVECQPASIAFRKLLAGVAAMEWRLTTEADKVRWRGYDFPKARGGKEWYLLPFMWHCACKPRCKT